MTLNVLDYNFERLRIERGNHLRKILMRKLRISLEGVKFSIGLSRFEVGSLCVLLCCFVGGGLR